MLQKLAEEYQLKAEKDEGDVALLKAYMMPGGRANWLTAEALGLERGYRLGRIQAAYDVRTGLDAITTNGSIRYDSDTESPPLWLMETAEKLARGDA